MAGGLFGQPFTLNEKCIVFSLIVIGIYLHTPTFEFQSTKYLTLAILFVFSYVAMAWYDYYYDCQLMPLRRAKYGLTTILKPPIHSAKQLSSKAKKTDTEKTRIALFIYLSHIVVFVPLLLYVAYKGKESGEVAFSLMAALGVLTLVYHGIKLMGLVHLPSLSSQLLLIYLTHILITAPLLIYIGTQQSNANPLAFKALYILAFSAFIYHSYYLYKKIN